MIKSFGNRRTEDIWNRNVIKGFSIELQRSALKKMLMLNRSKTLNDLKIPPSNHLEKLTGDLKGYYSIRINLQWRIIFTFADGDAYNVEIIDYH